MKRNSILGLFINLALCAIVAFFLSQPLFSKDDILIPDVSALRPFTADTHFMSVEGYVVSYVRIHYGRNITSSEARKLIKSRTYKNGSIAAASIKNEKACKSDEKQNHKLNYDRLSTHLNDLSKRCEELLKFFQKLSVSRPARRAEAELALAGHTSKRVLLIPAETGAGGTEAEELVKYFVKKRFSALGYEVIDSKRPGESKPLELKKDAVKNAKALGADLIVNYKTEKYRRGKKISIPGMLIDIAFLSVCNKAEISVSAKIYSVKKKAYIYQATAGSNKKRTVLGLFSGSKSVMAYAANSAVNKVFENFKN